MRKCACCYFSLAFFFPYKQLSLQKSEFCACADTSCTSAQRARPWTARTRSTCWTCRRPSSISATEMSLAPASTKISARTRTRRTAPRISQDASSALHTKDPRKPSLPQCRTTWWYCQDCPNPVPLCRNGSCYANYHDSATLELASEHARVCRAGARAAQASIEHAAQNFDNY